MPDTLTMTSTYLAVFWVTQSPHHRAAQSIVTERLYRRLQMPVAPVTERQHVSPALHFQAGIVRTVQAWEGR